eukprot:m51a1_g11273 hypothetical protein (327) ;mRNA; r:1413-2393
MSDDSSALSSAHGAGGNSFDWYLRVFHYYPSDALSIIALAGYFAIALPLVFAAVRSRNWVIYVLPLTAVAEGIGYVMRLAVAHKASLGLYCGYTLMVLLAPNALALVNYKVLGQIVRFERDDSVPEEQRRPPRVRLPLLMDKDGWVLGGRLAVVFFISDVVCFFLQMSGGGLQASGSKAGMTNGGYIVDAGLGAQLVFFGLFTRIGIYVCTSPRYQRSSNDCCKGSWTPKEDPRPRMTPRGRRNAFGCLFATIALLYIRNIYRFIEYVQGFDGYLASHEPFFFIFDTILIWIAFVVYTVWQYVEMFASGYALLKCPPADEKCVSMS